MAERVPEFRGAPVVSGWTANRILRAPPGRLEVSLDLGRSTAEVTCDSASVILPGDLKVSKQALAAAFSEPEDCISLEPGEPEKVYRYSERTRKYYKLYQAREDDAPTIVINGATMHSIVRKDPWTYTRDKVASVPRFRGACLDTCCGLGYSAQLLCERRAGKVTTCEADDNVLAVAALNPWSERLFASDRIGIVPQDLREHVRASRPGVYGCIFHDPPTVFQAGELYSAGLYRQFARVLQRGGVLYHYVGAPGGRTGRDYAGGVIRRLQGAGFKRTRRVVEGVVAQKVR